MFVYCCGCASSSRVGKTSVGKNKHSAVLLFSWNAIYYHHRAWGFFCCQYIISNFPLILAIYAFYFAFGRSILLAYGIHIELTPLSSLSTAILHDLSIGSTSNKYYAINIHLIVNFYFSLVLNFIRISRKIWAFKIDDSAFVVR